MIDFYDYKGFLPEIILINITITAITINAWNNPPVDNPGITPSRPNTHPIIQITATSQSKLLIIYILLVHDKSNTRKLS